MAIRYYWPIACCIVFALAGGAVSLPAAAEEQDKTFSFLVGFESATGGDAMGKLVVDGPDKGDVEAGGGMHIYLGLLYKPNHAFETRLTGGYHLDRSSTDSGTVYMDRYPIELIPAFCYDNHRFGLGLAYHTNILLHGNDFGNPDISFKDSLGYSAEYGYKLAPFLFLGFRYVKMSYEIENEVVTLDGEKNVNASHFGINLYYQH